ncbi:hypothetical protein EDD17DRAFT_1607452 [Pisolithus thermaeus]|nr:hypothetical protein EDD17DRAFT_1607452 [Pisolithus thermaeus]
MRWRLRSFRDFTISNIKEEIRSIQPATLMLIGDGALFYIPSHTNLDIVVLVVSSAVVSIYHTYLADITAPIVLALYSFCVRPNFTT